MIKITRFFYISFLCIPTFIVAYFTESLNTFLVAYCVAVIHELFHFFAALFLSVRVKSVIIMPFGVTMRLADNIIKIPEKEILIALAGPFANLLMIVLGKSMEYFGIWNKAGLFLFLYLNYIMIFINLLPCMPLDGGRIFRAFFVGKWGYLNTVTVQKKIEKILIGIILLLGMMLLFITKFNISLIMIAAFLVFNMTGEDERKNYVVMREMTAVGDKLKERKYMKVKNLAVREDVKALDVLKRTGYDSFYIVNVIDENGKICKNLTECELFEGIKRNTSNVCVKNISNL